MTETEAIPANYSEAVRTLVRWHAEGGPDDLLIFAFSDPHEQMVRLIEVSDEFLSSGTIQPMTFGRSAEFPFRSSTALATPAEWESVRAGTLPLPQGWVLAAAQQVWP
ncbi:MAG TPA: hypothetical protein VFC78_12505 [Tepidisphaeraceae bacterium]|nr:hypothetical protein [Tepidisphaeraceae bacterium]